METGPARFFSSQSPTIPDRFRVGWRLIQEVDEHQTFGVFVVDADKEGTTR